jgi:ubiquinone/menaquinone biosynthesis C-methylase UbiE
MEKRKEDYWGKFAHTFDEDQKYIVGEAIQRTIIEKLSTERDLGNAVEFGCGRGYYTGVIAKNAKQVVATDVSDEMLEMARRQLESFANITVQKADCYSTAFPAEAFDSVVMINLIHVIENPLNSLKESHRILKPGGTLLLASYTGFTMKRFDRIKLAIRFLRKWGKPCPYFQTGLSPNQLNTLVEKAGFTVQESQVIGDKSKALYLKATKK